MEQGRLFVDSTGVEWEVYDESQWTLTWALDWEYLPQDTPGLIFSSSLGRRRFFPCPSDWREMSDVQLQELLEAAATLS